MSDIVVDLANPLLTIDLANPLLTIDLTLAAGPPGPTGPAGPIGDASGAFLVTNRFSELTTAQAKIDARTNLELQHIDCGEYL